MLLTHVGIAELVRMGAYRGVHVKSRESQHTLAMLTARRLLKAKAYDLQRAIRGILLSFGLKVERRLISRFEQRVLTLIAGHRALDSIVIPLLYARAELLTQAKLLDLRVAELSAADPVCQLLMTAPGVGPYTALVFRATIDEGRRRRSIVPPRRTAWPCARREPSHA